MLTRLRRRMLREVAERLRALAQNDYMGASGGFYAEGRTLNEDADRLETLADSLEDEVSP